MTSATLTLRDIVHPSTGTTGSIPTATASNVLIQDGTSDENFDTEVKSGNSIALNARLRSTRMEGRLYNRGTSTRRLNLEVAVACAPNLPGIFRQSGTADVAPGSELKVTAWCPSGQRAVLGEMRRLP